MNKSNKNLILLAFSLLIGVTIQAMESKSKLDKFVSLLKSYKASPDRYATKLFEQFDSLSAYEKIEANQSAKKMGIDLEDLGLEIPKEAKKPQVEKPQGEKLTLKSDIAGVDYIKAGKERSNAEDELKKVKETVAERAKDRALIEPSYTNEKEEIDKLAKENKSLEKEIVNLEKEANKLKAKVPAPLQPSEARARATTIRLNKQLAAEIEQLKKHKEDLVKQASK